MNELKLRGEGELIRLHEELESEIRKCYRLEETLRGLNEYLRFLRNSSMLELIYQLPKAGDGDGA